MFAKINEEVITSCIIVRGLHSYIPFHEQVGPVDILVNNAGITRDLLTMMMKPTDFTDVINLNLNGVFFCSQVSQCDLF